MSFSWHRYTGPWGQTGFMSFECLVAADGDGDGDDGGHHDFWELEESSTGDGALSRLGSGTGMWPLSSVGNWKGQETFSNGGGFPEELACLSCIDTNGGSSQHPVLGAGCPSVLQRLPRAPAGGPGDAPVLLCPWGPQVDLTRCWQRVPLLS